VNAEPRHGELPVGPLLAAAGAVLLIVSLFLDWYEDITGFTVFEFLDLLLLMLALATIAALAAGMGLIRAPVSPAVSLALALLAVFVVLSQVINDPPPVAFAGTDKDIGVWLGLSGSALMVAGAVLGYAQISLAVETRPRERTVGRPAPSEPSVGRPAPSEPSDDPTRPLSDPEPPSRPGGPERS